MKLRKIVLFFTAPFRAVKRKLWDWINSSDHPVAESIRLNHYLEKIERLRRAV